MSQKLLLVLFAIVMNGCALVTKHPSATLIQNVDFPLTYIRSGIVETAPVGQRAISPNGREILSLHFVADRRGSYKPGLEAHQRFFARYLILGDRQPYDIEILVTRERRVKKSGQISYMAAGYDRQLAEELANRLTSELTKRREDRNIIDDFRVF